MKKINTSPISGAAELLPEAQAIFDDLKDKINTIYKKHGFTNVETPCIERDEILLAKAGGDTEKQIYQVKKTGEKPTVNSTQSLRFDHTVPLARYIVEHENDLTFPFRVSQIGINFRGERAQKGRFREFYQCDIDIIGRGNLPITYDVEIISTLLDVFNAFELNTPVLARISNRKILSGLLEALSLTEQSAEIFSIVDHAEKVTPEQSKTNLEELGLTKDQVQTLLHFINLRGKRSEIIKELGNLNIDNPTYNQGVTELDQILHLLESTGYSEQTSADLGIVRGLDYYTGTVFEFILPEHKNIGSVCGGGRYENLTGYFSDQTFPGVGGSIGLTRLFYVLNEHKLLKTPIKQLSDYAIIPISDQETECALKLAQQLRNQGYNAATVFSTKRLGDRLSRAAKIATNGIVIGESEVTSNNFNVKNFQTGQTTPLNLSNDSTHHDTPLADPSDFLSEPDSTSSLIQ